MTSYTLLWDGGDPSRDPADFVVGYVGPDKKAKLDQNLAPGQHCRCRVIATNELGDSPSSIAQTFSTSAGPPARPEPPELIAASPAKIVAGWAEPDGNGASVAEYSLEIERPVHGFQPIYVGPDRQFELTKLTRATEYKLRVSASNAHGQSRPSEVAVLMTAPDRPNAPAPPNVVRTTTTSIGLKYGPPAEDGGSPVISYAVELDAGSDTTEGRYARPKRLQQPFSLFNRPDTPLCPAPAHTFAFFVLH